MSIVDGAKHKMNKHSTIKINQLALDVSLGWTEEERKNLQTVYLDIQLKFTKLPKACETDDLNDTVCYDKLISTLKNALRERQFRLLENLAKEIYFIIKSCLAMEVRINLTITKHPQIKDLASVSFHYGDEEIAWSS